MNLLLSLVKPIKKTVITSQLGPIKKVPCPQSLFSGVCSVMLYTAAPCWSDLEQGSDWAGNLVCKQNTLDNLLNVAESVYTII